jgi:hypothetical protein
MVKVTVDDVEYIVNPCPPRLSAHTALCGHLMRRQVSTLEEAEEVNKLIGEICKLVLQASVKPYPEEEGHHLALYNHVISETNKTIEQFFPSSPKDLVSGQPSKSEAQ